MNKADFSGAMKFTPKYAKCDPIIIRGDWTYDTEKNRWVCNNSSPRCYNGMAFADDCCELIEATNAERI